MKVAKRNDRKTLHGFIGETCAPNTEHLYTDDWPAYNGCGDGNTKHESVNHSAEEWVRVDIHTNSVEGAFSLFKRAIVGSFHQVSSKHLDRYLDEFEFRFNNRKNPYLFRDTIERLVRGDKMSYETLTADSYT